MPENCRFSAGEPYDPESRMAIGDAAALDSGSRTFLAKSRPRQSAGRDLEEDRVRNDVVDEYTT